MSTAAFQAVDPALIPGQETDVSSGWLQGGCLTSSAGRLFCSENAQLSPGVSSQSPCLLAALRPPEASAFCLLGGLQAGLLTAVLVQEPGGRLFLAWHRTAPAAAAGGCTCQDKHAAMAGYR